jgi:hypothetical protein
MGQEIIVLLLFSVAIVYLARLLYRSFKPANGLCSKGCGSCGALDFDKIEKQIEEQQRTSGSSPGCDKKLL